MRKLQFSLSAVGIIGLAWWGFSISREAGGLSLLCVLCGYQFGYIDRGYFR